MEAELHASTPEKKCWDRILQDIKAKAVPLHAMKALGGDEV
jgi:hypothetical protein